VMKAVERIFGYEIPCVVICNDQEVPPHIAEIGEARGIPVLVTPLHTTLVSKRIWEQLELEFAECVTIHGSLIEVHDVGVLILGDAGIGKSECALELVTRGHRLVADDVVYVKCLGGSILMGCGSDVLRYRMEIRGMGIIDINRLFGARAVRPRKRIGLVALLEDWDEEKAYERLGIDDNYHEILKVKLPCMTIPVHPARNISTLIEIGALDQKLRSMGINSAKDFEREITARMEAQPEGMADTPRSQSST